MQAVLIVVTLLVVVGLTLASIAIMRRMGVKSNAPTTWAGRLPYIIIGLVLVVGGLLLSRGH